ncbi:MAG: hypothetical protein JW730_07110 [Anaerolineales bacterium]|nr:hypothetical protein [Anaerolineales bacterium]
MLKKQGAILFSVVLVFWFLAGCRTSTIAETPTFTPFVPTEDLVSNPFADAILDTNCTTPCWIGIQVGTTSFEEAKNILFLRYGTKNVSVVDNNHISWKATSIDGLSEGNIFLSDNIVSEILLYPDKRANFSTKNLFEILGEPTWAQVFQDPNNSCLGIDLIYSKAGVAVTLNAADNSKGVQSSQSIFFLRILDTELTEKWNANDSILIKWEGYKDYCQ